MSYGDLEHKILDPLSVHDSYNPKCVDVDVDVDFKPKNIYKYKLIHPHQYSCRCFIYIFICTYIIFLFKCFPLVAHFVLYYFEILIKK